VLSEKDIAAIWQVCQAADYGRIVQLLLLTGQRREEVGNMRWSEIDWEKAIWTLPPQRTKNKRTHEIPLAPQCLTILRNVPRIVGRDPVFGNGHSGFSGWSKAKVSLDTRLAACSRLSASWRLHDLRRTAATGMATLGVDPHIVEAVLNHVSGTRAGVAGIYNRATYRDEKRTALTKWAGCVDGIVSTCR
jgi:integrase